MVVVVNTDASAYDLTAGERINNNRSVFAGEESACSEERETASRESALLLCCWINVRE